MSKRKDYEQWLTKLGIPPHQKKSFGGDVPDQASYGAWLRRYHPIVFNVGFYEWKAGYRFPSPRGERNMSIERTPEDIKQTQAFLRKASQALGALGGKARAKGVQTRR